MTHGTVDLYLGAAVDEEIDGQPDAAALGDDAIVGADEDGLAVALPLAAGATAVLGLAITDPDDRTFAVYLYPVELQPANYVTVRVQETFQSRRKTPRALFVYATHTVAEDYFNVVQYNEVSRENEVYWATNDNWFDTQVMTLPLDPNLGPADLNVQVALTENDNDNRPVVVTVAAGGVSQEIVLYKETIRDMASVLNVTLQSIPTGTDELTITLFSPGPFDAKYGTGPRGGDSVAIVGAAANYLCRPADDK